MSVELAKELRVELHYGLDYLGKALEDGPNKTNATAKLVEARSAMLSYINSISREPYFKETRTHNNVIEMDPDIVADEDLAKEVTPSVKDVKILIGGLSMAIDKVLKIRLGKLMSLDPKNSYKSLRSLDRAGDSLESCIGFLHNELWDISKKNPGMYPTFLQPKADPAPEKETPAEAVNTNSMMEERAAVERSSTAAVSETVKVDQENSPEESTKPVQVEEGNKEILDDPNSGNIEFDHSKNIPSDPTEGFSEQPGSTTEND